MSLRADQMEAWQSMAFAGFRLLRRAKSPPRNDMCGKVPPKGDKFCKYLPNKNIRDLPFPRRRESTSVQKPPSWTPACAGATFRSV